MIAIAQIEAQTGNEKAYVDWLSKAAQIKPDALQPRSLLAQYQLRKKESAKALALAREAYDAKPNSPAALELLGNVQLAAGEKQNAKDSFSKLVELAPNSPAMHHKLAQSQIALNELEPARKSLNKVLELDENNLQARVDLVQILVKSGQHAEALKQADTLKRSTSKDPIGLILEGDILMAQKQYTSALSAYDHAARIKPGDAILLKQASALKAAGQATEADKRLEAWIKAHPDDHAVRMIYAESKMGAGQFAVAASHYAYLNQKQPGQLAILNNLAYALAQQKDKRAVTFAEQAYKLQPDNASVLDTYGWALTKTGQAAKGTTFLRQALSKAPDVGDIQYHYASALAASGDKVRALQELKELLKSAKDFPMEVEAKILLQQLTSKP
jgi:putative PEP-CTERM system TPR-repeat lipoprotein